MDTTIKFNSRHRFNGLLYDWHDDPYCGEHYQMTITDNEGKEVLHSYNAKPKTVEELRDAVLAIQKEIEIARHEEKERQKGWKQIEVIRSQQEAKQRKDSFKALKKEIGKYVIQYKSGERWKILFRNGEPLQFDTVSEAKAHIEKLKLSHPGIEFKQRKWLFKQNGMIE